MQEGPTQSGDGNAGYPVSLSDPTTRPTATELIGIVTRSQLEHALDAHTRGLKVYESLRSVNEIIGTQYGDRVLFELLQNAHDAHSVGECGDVTISLIISPEGTGTLHVANRGRPFSKSNLEAIRNIATSDKEIGEGIGNKGLGFRSVEALTADVHIFSVAARGPKPEFDGFCFRFATTEEIEQQLQCLGATPSVAKKVAADIPRYLVPIAVQKQSEEVRRLSSLGYATVVCLPLATASAVELAERQVAALANAAIPVQLFLERLGSLEISVVRPGGVAERVTLSRKVEPLTAQVPLNVSMQHVTLSGGAKFIVVRQTLDKEAVLGAVQRSVVAAPPLKRWLAWKGEAVVSIAVPLAGTDAKSRLYNFLPMDDHAISPMAGHVDAPFFADIDRRTIKPDLPLNRFLIEAAADTAAKGCLAIVDGGLPIPATVVVNMAAWGDTWFSIIVKAFENLGRPLDKAAIWPVTPIKGARWASFATLFVWPDVRTKQITPSRLAAIADADILSGVTDKEQLARVEALAAHLHLPLHVHSDCACQWVVATADHLAHKKRPVPLHWGEFYEDIVGLFTAAEINLSALTGRKMLLGEDNKLLVATAQGDESAPPVFVGRSAARGKRGDAPPNPPSAIARKFRFLNPRVALSEDVVHKFEKAGLVRRYDAIEVLSALKGAFEKSGTDIQRREALVWAFRVWLVTGDKAAQAALRQAELRVPCLAGWLPAEDALMSASWSTLGRTLEQYLDEAAPVSADCRTQRGRLLIDYGAWPRARADDRREDWLRFVQILGIRDGLQPVPIAMRREGTPNGYWNYFLRFGDPAIGFDATWAKHASGNEFRFPYTQYTVYGNAWRVPGQLEHDQLTDSAKESLSNLLIAYLRTHGGAHFDFALHHPRGHQTVSVPTPLLTFLREGKWPASTRLDQIVFARPRDSWSTTVARQHPPRFVPRFKSEPGAKEDLPPILFEARIGLRNWSDAASAPGRLASLGAALADLSAAERRDLRDQVRRAWGDVAEHRKSLPESLQLLVDRSSSFELLPGREEDPPTVYVTAEPQGFAARTLMDAGEAVLDVGGADAALICQLLEATARFTPKLADAGDVHLVVDGALFEASSDDPVLASGDLSWLSDLAVIAHEHLGDAIELRTLPTEELDRRIRLVRVRRCDRFALTIAGKEVAVTGRERAHAVPHPRTPTLLVQGAGPIDFELLLEASQALTKLLGARRNTLELLMGRLQRLGYTGGFVGPSEEMLARAIVRDISVVREHFAATRGGVKRRVDAVLPVVAFLKGREAAERLRERHAELGPSLQLRAWLVNHLPAELVEKLMAIVGETIDQKVICSHLDLDFGLYGYTLADLGYPPMNDEGDFRRMFSAYLSEFRQALRDRVRRAFLPQWRAGESLGTYVELRSLDFVPFDSQWAMQLQQLDRDHVFTHATQAIEARLGPDRPDLELEPLDLVTGANRKLVMSRHADLVNLVRAWCRKVAAAQPVAAGFADAQQLVRELDQAGLLDFQVYAPCDLPSLFRRAGAWPANMPLSDSLSDLDLAEAELKHEEQEARELRQKIEVARRSIVFAGQSIDTGGAQFILEFEALAVAAIEQSDEWLKRSRVARLLQQEEFPAPRPGTRGGGSGKSWANQPPEAIRRAMGTASEWLAWRLLYRRHPREMSDDCWVSSNRELFCTGKPGDDSLGYDFRVVTARHEILYEVKSAIDAGGEFELTAKELEMAGSAREDRKRRYRILYVPFVFDPTRWMVLTLPNPVGLDTRGRYRVLRSGSVRYGFDQR